MKGPYDLTEGLAHFELVELYYLQRAAVVDDTTIFMTVLFGFIAAAYLVGSKLSRTQAIGISLLYSMFSFLSIAGIYTSLQAAAQTSRVLIGPIGASPVYALPAMLMFCWAYSLWFLRDVRR